MLHEAKAKPQIIEAARKFERDFCRQRGHAAMHKTSAVTRPNDKWEVVSVDSFWWCSPHRDAKGNPVIQAMGISVLDEITNYHAACIIRTGGKNLANVSGSGFKKAFHHLWFKQFPHPKIVRFDEEGAFHDKSMVQWLESLDIQVQYAAGEAPWQVGRHSRHMATLIESMSTLALEQAPDLDVEEILSLPLGAKNWLHQVKGYSPNQWARLLVLNVAVKEAFLRADSRRRVLRAEKGKARRSESLEVGELAYFCRKGRSAASNRHPSWYGPARIVGIEKLGNIEDNQTQGSSIWISHGTMLYRCAPEQLRKVTGHLQHISGLLKQNSVWQDIKDAGNKSNYKDISQDLQDEPLDSEVREDEPPSVRVLPGSSCKPLNPDLKLLRLRGKQSER